MLLLYWLIDFLLIKILADKKIKIEKNDEEDDVLLIEYDTNISEKIKSNTNPQTSDALKPLIIPNTHSSNV